MSKSTTTTAKFVPAILATVEEYRAADRAGKMAIKKAAAAEMRAAIMAGDQTAAQAAITAADSYTSATVSLAKAPIDWQTIVQDRVNVLQTAINLLVSG